jgi:GT2 family glycosyltransferase
MGGTSSIGVQIVLFDNDPDHQIRLAQALAATLSYAKDRSSLERIVVRWGDCSSTPRLSSEVVETLQRRLGGVADHIEYEFFGENLGSAGGSNRLAELGTEEVIWILNPDTYPSPRAAELLLEALERPEVAAAEGRQLPVEHPKVYDPASGETEWVSGFCLMVRRSAYAAVGGFDPHYFPLYCDDVDLSWRLRLAGHLLVHVPEAAVFHDKRVVGDGSVQMSEHAVFDSGRARLFLARRYGRPDVEAELLSWIGSHGTPAHRRAADEFVRRERLGDVPPVIDGAANVATFLGADYAHHRFAHTVAVEETG